MHYVETYLNGCRLDSLVVTSRWVTSGPDSVSLSGVIFSFFLYVGLMSLIGSALRREHFICASIVGTVIGIFSLRLIPWTVHLAGLAGMVLSVALVLVFAGCIRPYMPYEYLPGHLLGAGLAGTVAALLVVCVALKLRAPQQM